MKPAPEIHPEVARKEYSSRAVWIVFGLLGVLIAAGVLVGFLPRMARQKELAASASTEGHTFPPVRVVHPKPAPPQTEIDLPGDMQALIETPIYARTDGYLVKRLVDISSIVKKDQVMAELETPETDQQLRQARATLAQSKAAVKQYQAAVLQAQANLKLAEVTYQRWKNLVDRGVVSRQEGDEKKAVFDVRQAEVAAAEANLNAAAEAVRANEANVQRLEEMKKFSVITAPFAGIVTGRFMDVGTLVNSGNKPQQEMFRIAQIDMMRVFVNVPQSYTPLIQLGRPAQVRVEEFPARVFPATVKSSTTSLDVSSRAMLVVCMVPNADHSLHPGMYAQVRFNLPRPASVLLIPGDTVVARSEGSLVAVVEAGNKVHYRKIRLGRDFGQQVEALEGVSASDLLVENPSDDVREGVQVEPQQAKK